MRVFKSFLHILSFVSCAAFALSDNYMSCVSGEPHFKLDLSQQFERTEDQRGGSCATYSATALYGAALFRNDPSFTDNETEDYLAPLDIDEGSVILHKMTSESGPRMDLQQIVDSMNSVSGDCSQFIKSSAALSFPVIQKAMNGNGDGYKNGDFPLEYLLRYGESVSLQDTSTSSESSGDALIEFVTALVHVCALRGDDKASTVKDVQSMLLKRLQSREQNQIKDFTSAFENFELYKESARSHPDFDAGDLLRGIDGKMRCQDSSAAQTFLKNRIKHLRAMLCAGIPMEASVNMEDLSYESSKDGGKSWIQKTRDDFYVHAMVITGLKDDYIVFRNSWVEGNNEIPAKSQLRIPFSDACRLSNIAAIVGEKDRERLSAVQFAAPVSEDDDGLPLGFRVLRPREDINSAP